MTSLARRSPSVRKLPRTEPWRSSWKRFRYRSRVRTRSRWSLRRRRSTLRTSANCLGPPTSRRASARGRGDTKLVFQIPNDRLASLSARTGRSLPVGNEGAGVVVAMGDNQRALLGRTVAIMGGAMLSRHRVVHAAEALPLPDGTAPVTGAAALINLLTLLAMIETKRDEAASSLGQMLNRVCLKDGIPLVNIVRRPEQVSLLTSQGASVVCDTGSASFLGDLDDALAATGATLAFDAQASTGDMARRSPSRSTSTAC